jgi:hypothetical protein
VPPLSAPSRSASGSRFPTGETRDRFTVPTWSAFLDGSEPAAHAVGAFDYVTKPLDPDALAKTVIDLLDRIGRGDRGSLLAETFGAS